MADIKVVIQLLDTIEDGEINSLKSSSAVNNASIQTTNTAFSTLSTKNNGTNMKSWANVIRDSDGNVVSKVVNGETVSQGLLSLADGYVGGANTKLIEQYGYNGYVFGAVPENNQLTVTLEIVGEYIDAVIIYGDKNANQFPTKAYRDGNVDDVIYSDDAVWAIKFDNVASSHTVTFLEWNRANYNACITYVAELKSKMYLDKSWIKSVESLSQSTGQPKDIYYGVTPSSGILEIIDRDGEIKDYLKDGILNPNNLSLKLDVNQNKIQEHISIDGEYSADILNLNLTNKLNSWDNMLHDARMLTDECSLYDLLKDVILGCGAVESEAELKLMLQSTIVYGENNTQVTVEEYLKTIMIPYPYIDADYLRNTIDMICAVAQLNVIETDEGNIKFVSARPIVTSEEKPIKINKRNIFGSKNYDIIVKNKYDGIECVKFDYTYDFVNSDSYYVEFLTLPTPEVINNKLYYPYDFSTFESDYQYSSKTYDNLVLIYDKALFIDDSNGYYSIYEYKPRNKTISKKDRHFVADYKVSRSKSIVSADSKYYLSPFQEYEQSFSVHHAGGLFTTTEFERGISVSGENVIINSIAMSDDGNWPYLFYQAGHVGTYTVYDSEGNYRYYVILPTYHTYYNTEAYSDGGIASKMYSINFLMKDLKHSEKQFRDGTNRVSINNNPLIQTDEIIEQLNNHIKQDYINGVRTLSVSVSCGDYFYIDNEMAKDWSNGEIIQVGDIVKVEGNSETWRVTGRNFRKVGVPMIDLELQEVRVVG